MCSLWAWSFPIASTVLPTLDGGLVDTQMEQKASSWAASSLTETDSSTPLPVLPEGFSQVRFLALGSGTENENLQIRSQGVVSEPDPEFSPPTQLDLWILDLISMAGSCFSAALSALVCCLFSYFICPQPPLAVMGFSYFPTYSVPLFLLPLYSLYELKTFSLYFYIQCPCCTAVKLWLNVFVSSHKMAMKGKQAKAKKRNWELVSS